MKFSSIIPSEVGGATYLHFYPLPALDGEFTAWKGILTDF